MGRRKLRAVPLAGALTLIILFMTAFAASVQAAATPQFIVGGGKALHASVSAKQLGWTFFLVPTLNTEFRCETFEVIEGLLTSSFHGQLKLLYKNCRVFTISTLEELLCHFYVSPTDKSLHITLTALLLPVEFPSGDFGILAEKIEAQMLLEETVKEKCFIPLNNKLKGELCLLIDGNETVEPLILSSQAIQESCPERPTLESLSEGKGVKDKLLFGVQPTFLDSTIHMVLTGAHMGKTFGVLLAEAPSPPRWTASQFSHMMSASSSLSW